MIVSDKEQAYKLIDELFEKFDKLEIKPYKSQRSNSQNRYFHGVVCALFGLEFGLTTEEAKEVLKCKFLQYEKKGKVFTKSTADLDTKEFEDFLTKCRMFSAQHGCNIPQPNAVNDDVLNFIEMNSAYL